MGQLSIFISGILPYNFYVHNHLISGNTRWCAIKFDFMIYGHADIDTSRMYKTVFSVGLHLVQRAEICQIGEYMVCGHISEGHNCCLSEISRKTKREWRTGGSLISKNETLVRGKAKCYLSMS